MRRYLSLLPLLLALVGPAAAQQIGIGFPAVPTASINTPGVVQPDNQTICLLAGGKLYSCSPLRTSTINSAILASDMGGQVNFNGTNLTATLSVITGSLFPTGASTLLCNYNATPLTITNAGGGPTVVGYTVPGTVPGMSSGGAASCLQLTSDGATLYAAPTSSGGLSPTGVGQLISGGFHMTPYSNGTVTSGTETIDCGNNPLQTLTNNGAFTLAMSASDQWCLLRITNGASAGVISFPGFTQGSNSGDTLATTNGNVFLLELSKIAGVPHYFVSALGLSSVTLTGVTLSASQFVYGAAANSVIGAVGVTATGGSFTGTLQLTGTDASRFALSSATLPSNLTCPSGTTCPTSGGPFNLNVVATQAGAGNSPLSQPETIYPYSYSTWDPAQLGTGVTLSNGNLTATANPAAWGSTQTTAAHSSGKYYFEFTSVSGGSSGNGIMFGIASTTPLNSFSGTTTVSYGAQFAQNSWYNNGGVHNNLYPAGNQTSSWGVAVDLTTKLIWIRNNATCGTWNTGGDPVAGTGGISISGVGGAGTNVYATFAGGAGGASATGNFGQGTFTCTPPTGYTGGW
jgi:hypothetical protein